MTPRGALLLTALLGGLLWLFHGASARGLSATPWSSYRSAPDGTKALYLTLQELGWRVERRHRDLAVEADPPALILSIQPDDVTDDELLGVADLLDAGTLLLVIADDTVEIPGALRPDLSPEAVRNDRLRQGVTADRIVRLIGDHVPRGARIQFDEHHHGLTSERGIAAYIADRGLVPAGLQLALAGWFLVAWVRRRAPDHGYESKHGGAEPAVADHADLVAAMAAVYRRGRATDHAAQHLMRGLNAELGRQRAPAPEWIERVRDLEVRHLQLRAGRPGEGALLAFAREVVRVQEEMHARS